MNFVSILFIIAGCIIATYSLRKLKFRYLILSALTGISAFLAVDFAGSFFEFSIPVNAFTLSTGAVGGIPGVILLTVINLILQKY